jgi:homospermidine synthase
LAGQFAGRVLVLGGGSVSQCSVPLLLDRVVAHPSQVTVMDYQDTRHRFEAALQAGINYITDKVTQENLESLLASYVSAGDVLIDLAWNIDANAIIGWCHDNGVLYLNTSVEEWDPYDAAGDRDPRERTLYFRHRRLKELTSQWAAGAPTAVVEHGANPGLVSHFVKKALFEIATRALSDGKAGADATVIESALAAEDYPTLAHRLGVKVIHVSERDTQITDKPKEVGEFVNTWSVAGFHEEGVAPAELGWGTHEKVLPPRALQHEDSQTQICLAQPGATTWVRSWVPDFETNGMVIRHGEAYTIAKHLTVVDESGTEIYRPTVHYAYCPTDSAIASMRELQANNWEYPERERILNDEIISGEDRLGVLLMGHPYTAWWTGSLLSIDEARRHVPHQNATTLQVAASVLACTMWMINNPTAGVCVPDDLPWREVLDVAMPYLGTIHSDSVDWTPLKNRKDLFDAWDGTTVDPDPWQFANFLTA